jgi:hypothetical protein
LGDLGKDERITRDRDELEYEIADWLQLGLVEWFLTTLKQNAYSHKIISLQHKQI